mgnify:CR=1 FL=1
MTIETRRPRGARVGLGRWSPGRWTSLAGLAAVAVLAGGLTVGLQRGAESASSGPADFEQQIPARNFVLAHATADHILERRARNRREETTVTVGRGDTLIGLVESAGVPHGEAFTAVRELQEVYSPRDLRPGQDIHLALLHDDTNGAATPRLAELSLRASPERDVEVRRTDEGGFEAAARARSLSRQVNAAAGAIDSSLFADGDAAGIPARIMLKVIHQYSYAVDFQRDLQPGDRFEIVHETFTEADGEVAKTGPLLYAALDVNGDHLEMYRFQISDGQVGYYNPKGESMRRLLMRTPVDGARLSSSYGMRKHPIKGYSRMHEGVDFAAPTGTPIYAAGHGTVVRAGRNGGYGNYVEIRHADGFTTAYAHMHDIADGIRRGAKVQQGDVIGEIGSTGASTGPHLHYEIHKAGKPVNPRSLDLPTGRRLTGGELERFRQAMADIDRLRRNAPGATRVAKACGEGDADDC